MKLLHNVYHPLLGYSSLETSMADEQESFLIKRVLQNGKKVIIKVQKHVRIKLNHSHQKAVIYYMGW